MAVSTTILTGPEVPGNRKLVTATITFDSSYVTGGEPLVLADLGLSRVDFITVSSGQGYHGAWDGSLTAPKILAYRQTSATGALVEVPSTTDLSAINFKVLVLGA
jgi:hypothetical protein